MLDFNVIFIIIYIKFLLLFILKNYQNIYLLLLDYLFINIKLLFIFKKL